MKSLKYINQIKKRGYCIIKNYFKNEEIQILINLVNKNYKSINYKGLPSRDKKDKIIYNLQNKDIYFIKLLQKPTIVEICKKFLDDEYFRLIDKKRPNYILSYYNARSSGEKLDLHIDSHIPYLGSKIFMMQFSIILEDQNRENGCTTVVPYSHKSGKFTNRKTKKIKYINSKKGDLVIWDSRLWHGTCKNKTTKTRWSLIATFSSWWLKQSMDMTKSLPKKIFNKLSINEKIMLGYCSVVPINEYGVLRTKKKISEIKFNI
jgi:hypothetical protein